MSLWDQIVDSACRWLCVVIPARARIVPRSDAPEIPLIIQFKIWGNDRGSSLFLQHFVNPENPDYFHVHRWEQMKSLVLSDSFTEERPVVEGLRAIRHKRFERYEMDRSVIHHVAYWGPRCWTLFWMSAEKTDDWGFFKRLETGELSALIPWREFVVQRIPNLETGEIKP